MSVSYRFTDRDLCKKKVSASRATTDGLYDEIVVRRFKRLLKNSSFFLLFETGKSLF
jgi:hypothetical protein